jgi:hypothetical protein
MYTFRGTIPVLVCSVLILGCTASPRDLAELVVADSLYLDPTTGARWTGPVYRPFEDDLERTQLEGELLDGAWEGELTVYHRNGRIRYIGSFRGGERCGPWTENADSILTESVYDALIREVETMGLYPPCDEER